MVNYVIDYVLCCVFVLSKTIYKIIYCCWRQNADSNATRNEF